LEAHELLNAEIADLTVQLPELPRWLRLAVRTRTRCHRRLHPQQVR
jgi:hypothetical protein